MEARTMEAMPVVTSEAIAALCHEFDAIDGGDDCHERLREVRVRGYRIGVCLEGVPCVARQLTPGQVERLRESGLL